MNQNSYREDDPTKEISRIINNQKSLLENMPEAVLLINSDQSVEYANKNADIFFQKLLNSDTSGKKDKNALEKLYIELLAIISKSLNQPKSIGLEKATINNVHIEYSIAPFIGYRGDQLYWVIFYDVTEQKNKEEEFSAFHSNIESILSSKIEDLNESERVRRQLSKQVNTLKHHLDSKISSSGIIGTSNVMQSLREMAIQVAASNATILITGESGTGKELIANLIHKTSDRRDKPFLKINCNAINDSLLESDLFGYEKGAFTGAISQKKGKFEVVDGGTLLLDEIGDISPRMQSSLLRILQNGEFIRVGGNKAIKVDVRIIAATNTDLAQAVQDGKFRLDLYYRLNIINISIPPLRERKEDISELVAHFVQKYRKAFNKDVNFVPKTIINKLIEHDWPGNVRELENVIQRAVLIAKSNIIAERDLHFNTPKENEAQEEFFSLIDNAEGLSLKEILAVMEKHVISAALKKHGGNVAHAATSLNVGKTAFYDKIKKHSIALK